MSLNPKRRSTGAVEILVPIERTKIKHRIKIRINMGKSLLNVIKKGDEGYK